MRKMARRRVLLLMKRSALDMYINRRRDPHFTSLLQSNHRVVGNLIDRHRVHEETVQICKNVLCHKPVEWNPVLRDELIAPISGVDLIITVGGDGTLLQASHFVDSSIPVFGVNSDPTQITEVEEKLEEFDATRSTGFLCAATAENFEQILDEILEGRKEPVELSRILVCIDGIPSNKYALNDVLFAHPNPAAVSHFTFSIKIDGTDECHFPVVHSRSSGLRVCTATGSTAAMKSAGGHHMPILSRDLQYMVREPILLHKQHSEVMWGWIRPTEAMHVTWTSRQGGIYIDGSHVFLPIYCGSRIEVSSKAPSLQIYLQSCYPYNVNT